MSADALTVKAKLFCEFYAQTTNGTEAAAKAGYKSPKVEAARLLTNANVQAYLMELTKPAEDERIADAKERQAFWTKVMRGEISNGDEAAALTDRLRASEILGKAQGDFVTKTEITGRDGKDLPAIMVSFIDSNEASELPE